MSIATVENSESSELAKFDAAEAAIAKLKPHLKLVVDGPDDKEGFEVVKAASKEAKDLRLDVESSRKALKKFYLEGGKKVDSKAKEIQALIEPIETHLVAQLNIVKDEEKRLAKIAAEERQAMIVSRQKQLQDVGYIAGHDEAARLSDETFAELLKTATDQHNAKLEAEAAEKKRQAELAEANRVEREKLEAEKAKQDAEAEEQREILRLEREKLEAENARIAAEQADAQAKIDEANAAAKSERERLDRIEFEREAKEKADAAAKQKAEADEAKRIADAEAKAEADRVEAKRKADAEAVENHRLAEEARQAELMKTDAQKIADFIASLEVTYPKLKSKKANAAVDRFNERYQALISELAEAVA